MSSHVDLSKSEFVVILIVQDVHEIGVERVNVVEFRELV